MGLKSAVEKLDKYFKRLDQGEAQEIKPSHVEKEVRKLEAKKAELLDKLAATGKPDEQQRLRGKLDTVNAQLERADWLQQQVSSPERPVSEAAPD